jgi:hypothetical protein
VLRSLIARRGARAEAKGAAPGEHEDPLLSFKTEKGPSAGPASDPLATGFRAAAWVMRPALKRHVLLWGALLIGIAAAGLYRSSRPGASPVEASALATGTAAISSRPEGLQVAIDGVARGATPLELTLAPGAHQLTIGTGSTPRVLPLVIEPGVRAVQYIELAIEPDVTTGRLEVTSDPPGASVRIDGTAAGSTPLSIGALAAGDHEVAIASAGSVVTRKVTVRPGATATVFAAVTPASAAAGWVVLEAPIDLEIHEDGRLIGTTAADRLMLPAGRHELTLVSAPLEFRKNVTVQIAPGRTTTTPVTVPEGSLSINALPWAEVWIDGKAVGTTPLANLPVPIGSREVVWRHPDLGERRRVVAVTAVSPVRIGEDFSR